MDNVEIPARRKDAPTLEERLTDNAYNNILPARYLDEGEEPEDLFERVAKNVAVAEAIHADDAPSHVSTDCLHEHADFPAPSDFLEEQDKVPFTEEYAPYFSYEGVREELAHDTEARKGMEHWAVEFHDLMSTLGFMPNTPTLINAGTDFQQLSACFTLSPEDDIDDIHEKAKEAAKIFQSGGGCGYSFSKLRPRGDPVSSSDGIASGPITFMRTFDQMCETIAQGGVRRGAQMGTMHIWHPDVLEFIHAKNKDVSLAATLRLNDPDDPTHNGFGQALEEAREIIEEETDEEGRLPNYFRNAIEGHLSNFNISVCVTDEFMECLENGEKFTMKNPRTGEPHVATQGTKDMYEWFGMGEYVEVGEVLEIPPEELWDRIVEGAHENGEPGIIYIDRVNDDHSFNVDEHPEHEIWTTNPCGEQPMENYEACNLGHINLSTVVKEDRPLWDDFAFNGSNLESKVSTYIMEAIDFEELGNRIEIGTRFLDNVVTMSDFPVDDIQDTVSQQRKIGLGIMGLAQLYVQLGVEYGSEEADEIARQIMTFINNESKMVSTYLAEEKGAFPEWENSKYANPAEYPEWFERQTGLDAEAHESGLPLRNHNTTTIAPTGTTSMIGDTSGGCEPIYNTVYYKNVTEDVQGDEMLVEVDGYFADVLEANGIDVDEVREEALELMEANEFETANDLETVPDEIADLFVTTSELPVEAHASVLCALQDGVDSSISKTLNAPNDSTVEDAKEIFEYVHENGGKSVTYYRDGSRTKQVLTTRQDNQETDEEETEEREFEGTNPEDWDKAPEEAWEDIQARNEEVDWDSEAMIEAREEKIKAQMEGEKRERPDVTKGQTRRVPTGYGNMYVTINEDRNGPIEIFTEIGKSGGVFHSFTESNARLVSLCLRYGIPLEDIVDQLEGIRSPEIAFHAGGTIDSIPDGIAHALKGYQNDKQVEQDWEKDAVEEEVKPNFSAVEEMDEELSADDSLCKECGSTRVQLDGGCPKCQDCGWSKC